MMPTIAEFDGITAKMYYNDHPPPHFHFEHGGDEAEMAIATLDLLAGDPAPSVLRKVRQWASTRQGDLALNWVKCQSHIQPDKL
jgi:hypothetical protein